MPLEGRRRPAARSALANAVGRSDALAITSPVERISGPSTGSAPGKRANGQHRGLDRDLSQGLSLRQGRGRTASRRRRGGTRPGRGSRRSPCSRTAPCARRAGSPRARRARPSAIASWTFRSPTTPRAGPSRETTSTTSSCSRRVSERRGQDAARVAGVHAGLLDVLHDGADVDVRARRRARRRRARSRSPGTGRRAGARRAPRPRARRPRRSRRACSARRARTRAARAPGSRLAPRPRPPHRARSPCPTAAPRSRAGRRAPRSARGPPRGRPHRTASRGCGSPPPRSRRASFSGVWPPNWMTTPSGRSRSQIGQHLLDPKRLEVEPVGGVVVGRDGLRVAVDHHGLVAELAEALRRVDAAVVELDPLADPVRAGAEDHDRATRAVLLLGRLFVGFAPGRVEVVGGGLDLAGAGIDARYDGRTPHALRAARAASSVVPQAAATSASECPSRFRRSQSSATRSSSASAGICSRSISARNQGWIPSGSSSRLAHGETEPASSSRERSAFRSASPNVRPIPIASPTDFICVPRVRSVPGTSRTRSAAP